MVETIEQVSGSDTRRSPDAWVKVARWGSVGIGLWAVVLQLIAGELIPPVAVIGAVFVIFAIFLADGRRKLALVAGLAALVATLGNVPILIDDLTHPSSAFTFILSAWVTIAALVVLISGWAAFRSWSDDSIRPLVIVSGGVFAGAVLIGLVSASQVESAQPLASDVQVVASGVEFEPQRLAVAEGETGFWLDNRDGIRHTFTIKGTEFEIDVPGLSAGRADFVLEAGGYTVICAVPGHENMTIDLTVER